MVCSTNIYNIKTSLTKGQGQVKKIKTAPKRKSTSKANKKQKPIDMELSALRHLIPCKDSDKKSDLEVILETIGYIQNLENQLQSQSSSDLLKAKFIAAHRMNLQHANED